MRFAAHAVLWVSLSIVGAAESSHWSLQPISRPNLPIVNDTMDRAIDRFISARLHDFSLTLSPEADARTLVRRLFYDVIVLPPTPSQVDQFVNDPSSDAYHRLV